MLQARKKQYDHRKLDDAHEPSLNSWGAHPDVVLGYHIFACSRRVNIIRLWKFTVQSAPTILQGRIKCFLQKQNQNKHLPHHPLPSESISFPCDMFNFTKAYLNTYKVPSLWHKSSFTQTSLIHVTQYQYNLMDIICVQYKPNNFTWPFTKLLSISFSKAKDPDSPNWPSGNSIGCSRRTVAGMAFLKCPACDSMGK